MPNRAHDLAQCLVQALGHLLSRRGPQGHWGDVRSTSLVVWAFAEVVSGRNARAGMLPDLESAIGDGRTWLIGQARREEGGFSWESEAWDTALAVLALSSGSDGERRDQGVAWLHRIRDPKSGVWYDEIWETSLIIVALLRTERDRQRSTHDVTPWLEPALGWFLGIPSKETGEFVCPHYTGFLAWILGEIRGSRLTETFRATDSFRQFEAKAKSAVTWLNRAAATGGAWSSYTFSNAYIAYGLSRLSPADLVEPSYADVLLRWLQQRQGRDGGFEDIEDTAIATVALSALIDATEEGRLSLETVARLMPKSPCRTRRCFIGYSGKSTGVAMAIKESLAVRMPALEIKDWRWDFQAGRTLIAEIERVSEACQLAIFIVTKDDQLVKAGRTLVDSPRDNIIFEVGYFAARLGMERTLLVVENGVNIPTDLGGILYIPLGDRHDLSGVNLALLDAIEKLARG